MEKSKESRGSSRELLDDARPESRPHDAAMKPPRAAGKEGWP
jgi:hypothetical protein